MLPCVVGDARCARIIFGSAAALVMVSLLPAFLGLGWVYLAGATIGGAWFLVKSAALARCPSRKTAMANFHASLWQLGLLLGAALLEGALTQ